MRHGTEPVSAHDLSGLRILASTGEAWDPESWRWLFQHAGGRRCPIINLSGGTEVGACLLSALPITPLKPCSLVGPALAMAVDVFDAEGKPLRGGCGELVCTKPWPRMTRDLGRSGAISRHLLVAVAGYLGARGLGLDRLGWRLVPAWPQRRHAQCGRKRLGPAEVESILAESKRWPSRPRSECRII